MGIPPSEVGYTSATTGREDHEVHKEHVAALGGEEEGGLERRRRRMRWWRLRRSRSRRGGK
jgi:hypothetical protein